MSELSIEQKYALDKFKRGENLFITGPGGTGKTKLIHTLVNHMNQSGINYQVCAMTGCAALLLGCKSRTLHSWSGIKLAKGSIDATIKQVIRSRKTVAAWRKIKVLIVDEVSMMSKKIFELCEKIARTIRKNENPFGGIQVIFTGDFFQLPPVGDEKEEDTSKFAFESEKWFQVFPMANNIQLTHIFRQTDQEYIKILLEIRRGEISEEGKQLLQKYVKRPFDKSEHNGTVPTKLFPVKSKVEYVNSAMFSKLEGEDVIFENIEKKNASVYVDTNKIIESEMILKCQALTTEEITYEIENMNKNINIDKTLKLKCGALVMCTFNIDLESGICNGSQGVIVEFRETPDYPNIKLPVVLFSNGQRRVISYQYYQNEEYPTIVIGQIPLCLAWALTIHKIQGATLDMADMDLGKSVFEYGQSYVALSRIKSLNGLYLSEFHPHRIKANPLVKAFYDRLLVVDRRLLDNMSSHTITTIENPIEPTSDNIFKEYEYKDPSIKMIKL
jgi:ATP-dependent DNA helicase PIF1